MLCELLLNKDKYVYHLDEVFNPGEKVCPRSKKVLRVNADGSLSPCCYLDDDCLEIGNVHKNRLIENLMSEKLFYYLQESKPGKDKCKRCMAGYVRYEKYWRQNE
jgi:radical SAM protein with 4Fe4S-binding SPASM domain